MNHYRSPTYFRLFETRLLTAGNYHNVSTILGFFVYYAHFTFDNDLQNVF